ncbi:hypothetical protein [Glycocaulis alkaliphilus]|uniref:hypothetical protein n=1 Tax=Glycocaulis alkaliphilus TaxID=1434191 RepID=UPI000FDA3C58|nr:hypothetical protein [Glycocaulis alkaliphilus]GGB66017.1 hypothetical protein GCM10007417_02160 [Glycocaulis alkaliphilus]
MFDSFSIEHASRSGKKDARREVIILAVFSLVPLILGYMASLILESWRYLIIEVFLSGDLYFYATSVSASVFITIQLKSHNNLTWVRAWSLVFVLTCIAMLAMYIAQKPFIALIPNLETSFTILHSVVSVLLFIGAFFIYYRVKVLSEQPPPSPDQVNRDQVNAEAAVVGVGYD